MNMKEKRIVLTAMFAVLLIVLHTMDSEVHASGAVLPYPQIMPYVPPNTAQLYDILFNSYGVTAVDESDESRKVAAYVDLVTKVLGAGAESFFDEMQGILDIAKTTAQINISQGTAAQMLQVVEYAMNVGYDTEDVQGYTRSEVIAKINQRAIELYQYPTIPTSYLDVIVDGLYQGESLIFHISGNYKGIDSGIVNTVTNQGFYAITLKQLTYRNGTWSIANFANTQFNVQVIEYYPTLDDFMRQGAKKKVVAKDTATKTSIENGTATIATPFTVVDTQTGIIDDTKPIVIQLPTTLPLPATTTQDIADTQEQLGVENVDTQDDVADVVEGLQTAYAEQYGDVAEYGLNLTELFPFCIPFDIGRILTMFVAEPQAPHFEFELPIGYNADDGVIFGEYEIDLAQFDTVAYWLRKGMLLLFIVGLGMITREKVLRG